MVDHNFYRIRDRVTKEAMHDWAESESSVLEYMRDCMVHQLAEELLKKLPIHRIPEGMFEERYYTEYEMNCVLVDENDYRELRKAKRDLQTLRNIIR